MSNIELAILIALFFVASAIGVVTGSNSLVTVPVMFQFGIDPKVAVATNMFGLTFLNIGACIPFIQKGVIDYKRLAPLTAITIVASAIGATLVGYISGPRLKIIVTVSMILVAIFILVKKQGGDAVREPGRTAVITALILTFFLGIYGGLYSGGYTTILTAVFVAFLGMSFGGAIAGTKFINVFSSGIATLVFAWQGLIDYKLGIILAVTMFVAAYLGAKTVTKLDEVWLRRIFLAAVFALAIKMALDFALR